MSKPIIMGDWGTSSGRLYLCAGETILDSKTMPGIKFTDSPEDDFTKTVDSWVQKHGPLDAIICGMVGSNIGWTDAGYIECPTRREDYGSSLITVPGTTGSIKIVPGVKTPCGLNGMPDIMRGEETQIFGFASRRDADGLICLPGTHAKWAQVKDGAIENFMTSLNGELFEVLLNYSVLVGDADLPPACIGDEYRRGVEIGGGDVPLSQLLMSVRAKQVLGDYDALQAKSYLLGLLIGSDVAGALQFAHGASVSVIGGSAPASFYAEAIRLLGGKAEVYGGQEASLTGLRHIMGASA